MSTNVLNTINITKKELSEILDSNSSVYETREKHHRHNGEYVTIVFPKNSKHYILTYLWMEDDGIYWDDNYGAVEVKKIEKIVTDWIPV